MKTNRLYFGGIAAGIIYLAGDIFGGILTPNYNYIENAASELIQTGAKNRLFLSFFFFFHAVAIMVLGIGLIQEYPKKISKAIKYVGVFLVIIGASHALSGSIFAMDPVGSEATIPGFIHLILVGISVIAIFTAFPLTGFGFYKLYKWKRFRTFTILSFIVILISGLSSPIIINNELPYMGLTERITGYVFYLWLFILSYKLIKFKQAY